MCALACLRVAVVLCRQFWLLLGVLALASAQGGYWSYKIHSACYTSQTCSTDGKCLSSSTSSAWDACPAGTYETSSVLKTDTGACSSTSCAWHAVITGCPSGTEQVGSSSFCGTWYSPAWKLNCCRRRASKTCRQWLACSGTWVSYKPVFGTGGAWSHTQPSGLNAYIAARLASGIYAGEEDVLDGVPYPDDAFAAWFCNAMSRAGARGCRVRVASGDVEYAVLNLGSSALVVFRGTESLTDMLQDATLLVSATMPSGDAYGIKGVALGYRSFLKDVLKMVSSDLAPMASLPVWFVGHSLGGAYATIAAMYWQTAGKTVAGVYTYGTAKAGTSDFATAYNRVLDSKTFRHEHTFKGQTIDGVVLAPYGSLQHVGTRVPVDRYGAICAASSLAHRHHHHHLRALLQATTTAESGKGAAAQGSNSAATSASGSGYETKFATFDFAKPWLDPPVAYTSAGSSKDCKDSLSLCHSAAYYWQSLYTCLNSAKRAAVGEF